MGHGKQQATAAEAKAMAHPLRLRILRLCLEEEMTNRELAVQLGKDPGTVLHHVRMLVDNGFLAAGEPRRGKRNSRERPYLATRKSWTLDFGDQDRPSIDVAAAEAFAAEFREAGPGASVTWSRLGVRLSAADKAELIERLEALVVDMESRDDPGGEPLSLYFAVHRRPGGRDRQSKAST